jgi:hypothetical protein
MVAGIIAERSLRASTASRSAAATAAAGVGNMSY